MIEETVKQSILQTLRDIEVQHQVRILYACESGSRAWGIHSSDSDYDVRFIYARPASAYLRLDVPRDVIERPISGDLDVSGWDVFKALRLLRKSNPSLFEWLFSPVNYLESSPVIGQLRGIAIQHFSEAAVFYHYRHMASGNYRQYIASKNPVLLKKYLYVVRPLVALLFLEKQRTLSPVYFPLTLYRVDLESEVRQAIEDLIERKQNGDELGMGAPNSLLNAWIDDLLTRWSKIPDDLNKVQSMTPRLNEALSVILAETSAVESLGEKG